jgi:hypothetical protein
MQTFIDDDAGYLRWVHNNPNGFVANVGKLPGGEIHPYMLHRSTCSFISSDKIKNYTTTSYIKACSLDKQELITWARGYRGMAACKVCKP